MIKWANPAWLWWIPMALAIGAVSVALALKRVRDFAQAIDPAIWDRLIPGFRKNARPLKMALLSAASVFLVASLARPQFGEEQETVQLTGMDIMLAVDVSNSMMVEDVAPSRLKLAQRALRGVVERLGGDRVGIVAFAGSAHLVSPLTSDHEYAIEAIDALSPQTIQFQGTDIGLALQTATQALERGAELNGKNSLGTKAIVLVSDGEDLEAQALEGAEKAKKAGIKLLVLGVGTEKGGPVPIRDESGQLVGYKRDEKRQPVVSRFSDGALKAVADRGDGRYWTLTPGQDEVVAISKEIGGFSRGDLSEKKISKALERYQAPLAAALVFLLIELGIPLKNTAQAALWVFALLSVSAPLRARAQAMAPNLDVYEENRQAIEAHKQGKLAEAQRRIGQAQALHPDSPELRYNQSTLQAETEQFDAAIRGFSDASKKAGDRMDFGLAARSKANEGIVQRKKGDRREGLESLIDAVELAKKSNDPKLLEDIRRKLLQQAQQRPQNRDGNKKDKKDGGGSSKPNDQDDPSQDPSKNPQGDKDQEKRYEDPSKSRRRQKFKAEKLNGEDADRVMSELLDREKQLQRRLNKQKPKGGDRGRDW